MENMGISTFISILPILFLSSCFVSSTSVGSYYLNIKEMEMHYPIEDDQQAVKITDSILLTVSNNLPANWTIKETDSYIFLESKESVQISFDSNNQTYQPSDDSIHTTTPKLKLNKFNITDTTLIVKSINKLDSLSKIMQENSSCVFNTCYHSTFSFVHFNSLWRQKMYDRRKERKAKRQRKPCQYFDDSSVQKKYEELKKSTPILFSRSLALGNMKTNWTYCSAETQVKIEPKKMAAEMEQIMELLKSTFKESP